MSALEPFFMAEFFGTATWLWLIFITIVTGLLVFDLGVLHREQREIGVKESLLLSAGYITVGLLFGLWVWQVKGDVAGMDYYTGFLIEKSLSMDNVFLMAMIFSFLAIPRKYQHEVLFWGILGVIVLRAIFIGLGATLIAEFNWVLYLFGAFWLLTGVKMLFSKVDDHPDLSENRLVKFVRRRMRVTDRLHEGRFFFAPARCRRTHGGMGYAVVPGTGAHRMCRPVVRRGQRAGNLRDHPGPLHCLHLQHLRDLGAASVVLRSGCDDPSVRLP